MALTQDEKSELERIGDAIERLSTRIRYEGLITHRQHQDACALAWDFKQAARKGTTSEGL